MKEHPILMSAPMSRALLEGRKTQTRRICKPAALLSFVVDLGDGTFGDEEGEVRFACPYGRPGDRLWVRETWAELLAVSPASDQPIPITDGERLIEPPTSYIDPRSGNTRWNYDGRLIAYRANSKIEFCDGDGFMGDFADRRDMPRWRPSIHMPRWASRITLEVTEVRVQRLQDITERDAHDEGVDRPPRPFPIWGMGGGTAAEAKAQDQWIREFDNWHRVHFEWLWASIHGAENWLLNPWVWAITFKRVAQ
jgi:hypothetical protein